MFAFETIGLHSYRHVISFLDLKEVFSAASGKPECGSYQELMDAIGEEDFRDLESKVMDQVHPPCALFTSLFYAQR